MLAPRGIVPRRPFGRRLAFVRTLAAAAALWTGAGLASALPAIQPGEKADPQAFKEQMIEAMEDSPFMAMADMDVSGMTSGKGFFGAMFGPSVTRADFKKFCEILKLDKAQMEAANTIYAQRLENYEAQGKPLQEMIAELMKNIGKRIGNGEAGKEPEGAEKIEKAAEEIQKERAEMARGVMEDLKDLANEEQRKNLTKVELAHRRNILMRSQPMQMTPGVRVDLRDVLETTLQKKDVVRPDAAAMQRVEQALAANDEAVDTQAQLLAPLDERMRAQSMGGSRQSPEQMQAGFKLLADGIKIVERIRAANDTAFRSISDALPEPTRAAFADAFHAATFPQVYSPTHGEKTIDAALKFSDLTPDQREKLTRMKEDYSVKLKGMRPKAADYLLQSFRDQMSFITAKDDEERAKNMEKMGAAFMGGNPRSEMRAADKDIVKQVKALMSDAQAGRLPAKPKPNLPFEIPDIAPPDAPPAATPAKK